MKQSLGAVIFAYPTPIFLIGTYDNNGHPNIAPVSWGGICCAKPPCVTVSLRKATQTFANLIARKVFTISIPSESQLKQVDACGMTSGRNINKFVHARFSQARSQVVYAPYIKECLAIVECKVRHSLELGLHTQFIGEVLDVKADKSVILADGLVDLLRIRPLIFGPDTCEYYGVGKMLGKAFATGKKTRQHHADFP